MASGGEHHGAAGRSAWWRAAAVLLVLAIVPSVVVGVSAAARSAVVARWVAPYYDPDYEYMLNSLNIAEGAAPRHTDHPGTVMQELGAGVIHARHVLTGADGSMRDQVLHDPEGTLGAISGCLQALHAAALLLLGWMTRRLTGSLLCGVAAQAASVASEIALFSMWRVNPEPLVMTLSLTLASVTIAAVQRGPGTRFGVIAGVLAGLGMATKVTFLPVCLAPLWAMRRVPRLGVYIASTLATFLIAVLPILAQAERAEEWFIRLIVGDGRYGGTRGHLFVDPSRYVFNLRRMVTTEPAAALAAGVSAVLLLHIWATGRWRLLGPEAHRAVGALAWASVAEALQYVMVAKHPGARYLLPALSLCGVNVALGYVVLRDAYTGAARRSATATALAVLTILACGAARAGTRVARDIAAHKRGNPPVAALHEAAEDLARREGSRLVIMYNGSSPAYALLYADGWAGHRYRADLARMFPHQIVIEEFTRHYEMRGAEVPLEQMKAWAAEGRLLFQGPLGLMTPDFEYEEVKVMGAEGLYRARLLERDRGK